ncbi:MAG: sialidase family protein [Ginsengibacter sp.]
MKKICLSLLSGFIFLTAFTQKNENSEKIIANGHMPAIAKDKENNIHIVYGNGDSIMYIFSKDGKSYSTPALVAVLPELAASATRGPQIAAVSGGLVITAGDKSGNIYSYKKEKLAKWSGAKRVNDINEISKEGLMSLSADGLNVYAIWLGVNDPKGQSLYGAGSADGGNTWRKNIIVYVSPSGTVCECCKPSVVVKGNKVYAMFRNYLNGNRDLYLAESPDGGKHFAQAKKLGNGSWKLNGCPMDGGGIALNNDEIPQTVWRRQGKIYSAEPGKSEKEIGEGRSCSIETINNKNMYAWTEKENIFVFKPDGEKINLGKGSLPILKAINKEKVICVWENEDKIHTAVLNL